MSSDERQKKSTGTRLQCIIFFLVVSGILLSSLAPKFVNLVFSLLFDNLDAPLGKARTLEAYPKARCLDGSAGRYYFRSGSGDGKTKFLIFAEGGGFCTSDSDCAQRAKTHLGSTMNDPDEMQLSHPFFSQSKQDNPLLWNWNLVFVRYCDGAYMSGARVAPVQVKSFWGEGVVHYNGEHISRAVMADLSKQSGLGSATDVVFSGCSAGGIHTFAHLDALRDMVPKKAVVVGFPDSGFYLDFPMFRQPKEFVVAEHGQNATGLLNKACLADNPGAEERCLIAAIAAPYLRTAVFAWQSRYDTDQEKCEMSFWCRWSQDCIRDYGGNLTSEVHRALLANPKNGVFLDSCSRHCALTNLPRDHTSQKNPTQAFSEWYARNGRIYGQDRTYPCSDCCS